MLSPPAAVFGMPDSTGGGDRHGSLCALLHHDESNSATVGRSDSEQAPKQDSAHGSGLCSLCQLGSGAAAFEPRTTSAGHIRLSWSRPVFDLHEDVVLVYRVNHNATARAPPSFA